MEGAGFQKPSGTLSFDNAGKRPRFNGVTVAVAKSSPLNKPTFCGFNSKVRTKRAIDGANDRVEFGRFQPSRVKRRMTVHLLHVFTSCR